MDARVCLRGRPGSVVRPYVFVYGTLRRAYPRTHRLLGATRFVALGSIAGALYDLGTYPGVCRTTRREARVAGELYELIGPGVDRRLVEIDRYEGPAFRRTRVTVRLEDGRRHRAWTYLLADAPPHHAREIRAGIHPGRPAAGRRASAEPPRPASGPTPAAR